MTTTGKFWREGNLARRREEFVRHQGTLNGRRFDGEDPGAMLRRATFLATKANLEYVLSVKRLSHGHDLVSFFLSHPISPLSNAKMLPWIVQKD